MVRIRVRYVRPGQVSAESTSTETVKIHGANSCDVLGRSQSVFSLLPLLLLLGYCCVFAPGQRGVCFVAGCRGDLPVPSLPLRILSGALDLNFGAPHL